MKKVLDKRELAYMIKKIMSKNRSIPSIIKFQLIAQSAGRCEFPGCNKPLYEDELTKQRAKLSNYAHIIPFEENGPRGPETRDERPDDIHSLENLMLLCWEHHKIIDTVPVPEAYSAEKLREYKKLHEDRIKLASSIQPEFQTYVVVYATRILSGNAAISYDEARRALFPDYYPAEGDVIDLSPELGDMPQNKEWYRAAACDLECKYREFIQRRLKRDSSARFAVFALAPMSLLIRLGSLMDDKQNVMVYQKQRDKGWNWVNSAPERTFKIIRPQGKIGKKSVLLLMLTDDIDDKLVHQSVGKDVSIWKITSDYHGRDFVLRQQHLIDFKRYIHEVLDDIIKVHQINEALHVFPIMPVSACVEFGRVRVAAHNPWIIYERSRKTGKFVKMLTIK